MRGRPLLAALALFSSWLFGSSAGADPVQIDIRAAVPVPQRPQVTLKADEAVRDLSLTLSPGPAPKDQPGAENPETAQKRFSQRAMAPGQSATISLGTGMAGRTLWSGALSYLAGGKSWHQELHFDTVVTPALKVGYDREHLDLSKHYVEVQLSRPAGRAEISVVGEDGGQMGAAQVAFHGERPGTWLRIPWTEKAPGEVLKLDLKIYDQAGFPIHLQLFPWSVPVQHEEVNFPTASWEILPAERGKLDESHRRILQILARVKGKAEARLFVGGHTDTVGSDADNRVLSRNRARAIAGYFAQKGIGAPIFYAGSGEAVPRVQTEDNVDEPRNRRADYVLSVDLPRLPAGVSWQKLE